MTGLAEDQIQRYSRHILLDAVGGEGQARLLASSVLVVGAGGLGSPLLLYLTAAGVGTLHVVENDTLERSNLNRQVLYDEDALDRPKGAAARERLRRLNPDVRVVTHDTRLDAANAADLVGAAQVVADGSDNAATRFLVNATCHAVGRPLVSAAVTGFDGQLATFRSFEGPPRPCYRCLYSEPARDGPSCATAGVLGAVAGVMGALQATEVVKELLGLGDSLAGHLLLYDGLRTEFRRLRLPRDPQCPVCGGG